ncbi:MAG: DnaJ domain-containing protein [Fimbriimonadaceae bacterium]|nr:DnaJ domain-containing protein [Alphaproteobacteria bacterium]
MKLESKYFDSIRVKPEKDLRRRENKPHCSWKGCEKTGDHKAPMGRGNEGEYYSFCLGHVREYNKSYNYFSGMTDSELKDYQESARTGHRPTWTRSDSSAGQSGTGKRKAGRPTARRIKDPLNLTGAGTRTRSSDQPDRKVVRNVERKSLMALDLDSSATSDEIKMRYKELVKRHHPDANGGDRACEDKLREIIQAYNYLKTAGFC